MVCWTPLIVTDRPMTAGSSPSLDRQYLSLRMTTGAEPARPSSGWKRRPSRGTAPSVVSKPGRHLRCGQLLWLHSAGDDDGGVTVRFDGFEDLCFAAPLPQLLRATAPETRCPPSAATFMQVVELFGVFEWTRAQQDGIDDAEDGGVGRNRKAEREDREEHHRGLRPQAPQCIADILHERGERPDAATLLE